MKIVIVPVSGGKDSQVVLSLAIAAVGRENVLAVHQDTGWDHPLTYDHIEYMQDFYSIPIEFTKPDDRYRGGMLSFLRAVGYFPSSASRGCTQRLKQEPFLRWLKEKGAKRETHEIWMGMRAGESKQRASKYGDLDSNDLFPLSLISNFYSDHEQGSILCRLPIVNWDETDVFIRIADDGAKRNPLYDKGHDRVGCYPCLIAKKKEWQLAARDCVGRAHIKELIGIEEKWNRDGNPRKCIKVHPVWDVKMFLSEATEGLIPDFDESQCQWCNI